MKNNFRKLFGLTTLFLFIFATKNQAQTANTFTPVLNKQYKITNVNMGQNLTNRSVQGEVRVYTFNDTDDKKFVFELANEANNTYFIKSVLTGTYLTLNGSYNMTFGATGTEFQLIVYGGVNPNSIVIKKYGVNGYLGVDAWDGLVYHDKTDMTNNKNRWYLNFVTTEGFEPVESNFYMIKHHTADLALTKKTDAMAEMQTSNISNLAHRIRFEKVGETNKYYIINGNNERLFKTTAAPNANSWDVKWEANNSNTGNQYEFTFETVGSNYVRIISVQRGATNNNLGTIYNTTGNGVWADYGTGYWRIVDITDDITTSYKTVEINSNFKVLQNNRLLQVNYNGNEQVYVTVRNELGKEIISQNMNASNDTFNQKLNQGLYFVSLVCNGKISTQKVLVK